MQKEKVKDQNNAPAAQAEEKNEVARREEEMLAFWNEHDIFYKSLEKKSPKGDFVFYDGPPFATGLPHYGHILASTIKDTIPRYRTMRGYHVKRKWGWDCHGLPLENLIEKKLGLATKRDIEELGVKKFNEAARDAVMEFADDWRRIIPRMGRWVDMDDDYKTMDPRYTESVWHVFSELYKKGLVYEGFKSMHLCPRCGTTLSNFEVNLGYQDIKDIAVTVKLPLLDENGKKTDTSLLVWTTTPWTLPGNMAAAVHNDFDYVKVRMTNDELGITENVILAKERLEQLGTEEYEILETLKGSELIGCSYEPLFDYWKKQEFKNKENAWKIYHAPYVELGDEGTGAVHLAPAYGDEDMELAKEHNIPIVHHVSEDGRFKEFVTDFAGHIVKPKDDDDAGVTHLDTDIEVLKKLKENGTLFRKENVTHSYPHCWRCDTPLLNYATTSWFVEVSKMRDKLVSENQKVHWVPEHVGRARFGKWLEGALDWAISRQRYWGAPLPIWKNPETKEAKVFGSLAELREYVPRSGNRYLLMRHGESRSNVEQVTSPDVDGDDPLTDTGEEQVRSAIPSLKEANIDLIIASPFVRTKMTAERIATELGLSDEQIVYDDRIGEIQTGEFAGKSIEDYHRFLDSGAKWCDCAPMDGESWHDVKRRVGAFLYEIEQKYAQKNILIISHNSPLRMLGAVNDGISLNTTEFDHDADGKAYGNAEIRELPFIPMPHNDNYELDFHRPYIDEIVLHDADGTQLERVEDVFDCWFESGSMPYGQQHYPFEHTDVFDPKEGKGYPANFIAEGLDQTRGWFYSLIVLGTALFNKAPYQNVIVNGTILAEDGQKMSKRLQNYPDPMEIADTYGVDSMRFYLLASPVMRAEDLNFSEKGVLELQRKNIGRLHNVLLMYQQYADGFIAPSVDSEHILDRWILARLGELVRDATAGFESYELDKATRPVTDFIDDLSVWYLRRSRDRLKGEDAKDKGAALATLKYALKQLALIMAPSMPFYSEYLYRELRSDDEPESVHLCDWPEVRGVDQQVLDDMTVVREVVSDALEARAQAGIKVRQPLQSLSVAHELFEIESPHTALVKDEVNVKEIIYNADTPSVSLDTTITPELKKEGEAREFIRSVQGMRKDADLKPHDRITLTVTTDAGGQELLQAFKDEVMQTTGADELVFGEAAGKEVDTGDHSFTISVAKR